MRRTFLSNLRKEKGIQAQDVAKKLGIVKSHYAKIERGSANPSLKLACRMEKLFGVPVCTLLKKDGDDE